MRMLIQSRSVKLLFLSLVLPALMSLASSRAWAQG